MQPTPVFSPGESHGHRSLVGYSPCGPKESDTPEGQTVLGLPRCPGAFLPLSLAQEAFLFAAVPRLLALMACLVTGQGSGPRGLSICGPRGIFSKQGWNPHPLRWRLDSYTPSHQGNPVAARVPPVSFLILCIESHVVAF